MADRISDLWREAYENGATPELIEELLRLDPAQALARRYGLTLLQIAANHRLHGAVAVLLSMEVEVNAAEDFSGKTALHLAAWNLDPEGCIQLLKAGADPTIRDRHGRTPFDVAVHGDIWEPREAWEATQRILAAAEVGKLTRSAQQLLGEPKRMHAEPVAAPDPARDGGSGAS